MIWAIVSRSLRRARAGLGAEERDEGMVFGRMGIRDSMAVCAIVVKDDDCEMSNLTTGPLPLALLLVLVTGASTAAMVGVVSSASAGAAISSMAVSGSLFSAVSSAGVGSTAAGESSSEEEEEDIGGN